MLSFVFALLLVVWIPSLTEGTGRRCKKRLSARERCNNLPVVKNVDLDAYTGLWYQIYASGDARRVSSIYCVTANYTLSQKSPVMIDVLNCQDRQEFDKPQCVEGTASIRPDAEYDSQLQVSFSERAPPGDYNIVALLGYPNYGYHAAAVYSCSILEQQAERISDGFFILSRTPYAPAFILRRMLAELRCNGYEVNFNEFVKTIHYPNCTYFDGPNSFDVNPARSIPDLPDPEARSDISYVVDLNVTTRGI